MFSSFVFYMLAGFIVFSSIIIVFWKCVFTANRETNKIFTIRSGSCFWARYGIYNLPKGIYMLQYWKKEGGYEE